MQHTCNTGLCCSGVRGLRPAPSVVRASGTAKSQHPAVACCSSGCSADQSDISAAPRIEEQARCSRRALVGLCGAAAVALSAWPSAAATQLLGGPAQRSGLDFSNLLNPALYTPPQPVLFPRKSLNQRFAVLLMRSGYEAVDALDFIPMDAFQKAFWKLRQSEQEAYALQYSPLVVKKGDLSDPLYLDFIAAMQYAVIGREMGRGQQVFTEYCEECEGGRRVVRRDPALADNASLPAEHDRLVGDIIFTGLRDGFRGEVFGGPGALPPSAGLEEVVAGVQALLDVMVNNGFALKSEVTDVEPGQPSRLRIVTRGPANLWGLNSLTFRRSPVVNAYDALAAAAFLRASGRPPVSVQMTLTDTGVEHTFLLA